MVAPFAGAWIEIYSRELANDRQIVAPFAGAWIEIQNQPINTIQKYRRSLRGSVD